eukprot:745488-Pelagomonas_calceolata.AAC.2
MSNSSLSHLEVTHLGKPHIRLLSKPPQPSLLKRKDCASLSCMHPPVQLVCERQQLLTLRCHQLSHWDAGPSGDDLRAHIATVQRQRVMCLMSCYFRMLGGGGGNSVEDDLSTYCDSAKTLGGVPSSRVFKQAWSLVRQTVVEHLSAHCNSTAGHAKHAGSPLHSHSQKRLPSWLLAPVLMEVCACCMVVHGWMDRWVHTGARMHGWCMHACP